MLRTLQALMEAGKLDPSLKPKLDEKLKQENEQQAQKQFQDLQAKQVDISKPEEQEKIVENVQADQQKKTAAGISMAADQISSANRDANAEFEKSSAAASRYAQEIQQPKEDSLMAALQRMKKRGQ